MEDYISKKCCHDYFPNVNPPNDSLRKIGASAVIDTLKHLGPNSQHLIFFVTYEWAQLANAFVPGRPCQPSLIFASKATAYPCEATFRCSTLW
jgi:hypothetical protein